MYSLDKFSSCNCVTGTTIVTTMARHTESGMIRPTDSSMTFAIGKSEEE